MNDGKGFNQTARIENFVAGLQSKVFFVSAQLENDSTSIQIVFIIPMLAMMKLNSTFIDAARPKFCSNENEIEICRNLNF